MQPLQYDPQCPAAKDNSISHAAAAPSKHDAAVTMSYRDIEFQNTLEEKYEQTREKFQLQNPLSGPKQKKLFFKHTVRTCRMSSPPEATLHGKTQGFVLGLPLQHKSHATCTQPLQCDVQLAIQHAHRTTRMNNHTLQNSKGEPITRQNERSAPTHTHTSYLSSPAAATLHGKTQGFVLRLSPQNKAHATFMQPLR